MTARACSIEERLAEELSGDRVIASFFSTYSFDHSFFEETVLPLIEQGTARGTVQATVVVDSTRYADDKAHGGRGYDVIKAKIGRVWHAKVISLFTNGQNGRRTLLAIGSGNLTRPGWQRNRELFSVEAWTDWKLPRALMEWLEEPWIRDRWFGDWAIKQKNVAPMNAMNGRRLVSSLKMPLWDQVKWLAEPWTEAHVIAPFSDAAEDPDAAGWSKKFLLELTKNARSGAQLSIYLRGLDKNGLKVVGSRNVLEEVRGRIGKLSVRPIWPDPGLLHAKLVALKVSGKWSILLGSPNATAPAMLSRDANIELAWDITSEGNKLLADILPAVPSIPLSKLQFQQNKITNDKRWDAIATARFISTSKTHGRINWDWAYGHGPHDTRVELGQGNTVLKNNEVIGLVDIDDWYLKTTALGQQSHYPPSFVPIEMPADAVALASGNHRLSPDEWLDQIAGTVRVEDANGDANAAGSGNGKTKGKKKGTKKKDTPLVFKWRERVSDFDRQLRALEERIWHAETPQVIALIRRDLAGAWDAHRPDTGDPVEDAWKYWVRAGLWQSLNRTLDGRTIRHRPLVELARSWNVKKELRVFPIAGE